MITYSTGGPKKETANMLERTLLIDDLRPFNVNIIARTYVDGIWELRHHGPWDVLYLDHDLGNNSYDKHLDRDRTGYDVLCWLEEHKQFLPKKIVVVSDNAVGIQKMKQTIEILYS
jgi:hypothetical protein